MKSLKFSTVLVAVALLSTGTQWHSANGQQTNSEGGGGSQCEHQVLDQCIKMADPLLKEPKHVFPSTADDIDHVCRVIFPQTWSEFIACIKSFTSNCLSNGQRAEFNRAVGDSINSVHKMCTNDDYKSAYLRRAECILGKAMGEDTCKSHYEKLVSLIQETSSGPDLCCAHESFKLCIIEESKECPCSESDCRDDENTETASHFAKVIMENSLGFLLKQCSNQVPVKPCVGGYTVKKPRFEPEEVAPETNRGSTYFPTGDNRRPVSSTSEDGGATTTTSSGDPRHPKEVTTDEEDFAIHDIQDNNFFGPSNNGDTDSEDPDAIQFQPDVPTGTPAAAPTTTSSRYPAWLPDTEIKDFDEFLKNTLQQAGFSSQGLRSAATHLTTTTTATSLTILSICVFLML